MLSWSERRKEWSAYMWYLGKWVDLRLGGPEKPLTEYILSNEERVMQKAKIYS